MKHQYIFLRHVEELTADSVIYHVWISEGKRGNALAKAISEYAAKNGHWFELWGEHVDYRIDYYEERVFWSKPLAVRRFRSTHISGRDLSLLIGEGLFSAFEEHLTMPRLFFLIMWSAYPSVNLFPNNGKWKNPCPSSPRKYLCQRGERSLIDAVIGFALIALFYIVGMGLEALEKYLLY